MCLDGRHGPPYQEDRRSLPIIDYPGLFGLVDGSQSYNLNTARKKSADYKVPAIISP
jgi:hypothetical protein